MEHTKSEYIKQDYDYRRFLRKSVEIFREATSKKVESYDIKIPSSY